MRHLIFEEASSYPVALLTKASAFNKKDLVQHYLLPWKSMGVQAKDVIGFTLEVDGKKVSDKFAKTYLEDLLPILKEQGVKYMYCCDGTYFKILTKQRKADPHQGYAMPCAIKGYEHMFVVLGLNHQQLVYNPDLVDKLRQGLTTIADHMRGTYQAPGTGIIHKVIYPKTVEEIRDTLEALKAYPEVTMDIEAFSLDFWKAGIGTMSIAIDEHHGVAFACDYKEVEYPEDVTGNVYGQYIPNHAVRALIKDFLLTYKGRITWHNAAYDVKVVIFVLWMQSLLDQQGLLEGLEVMSARMDDTKIITYLATNSTAGNVLGLKPLAQEFAGNWAKDDIKDIRLIPLPDLLQYNLVDALSTWFVKKKYYPIMVQDKQEDLYHKLFMPSAKLICQMELTGMPMSKKKIAEGKAKLEAIRDKQLTVIRGSGVIKAIDLLLQEKAWNKDFEDRRNKAKNPQNIKPKDQSAFADVEFNPNSSPQLQVLLYEMMGLPVLDYTETKQPATGAETIEKLINHTTVPEYKALLAALIEYGGVIKILSTFIPAFEGAINKDPSKPDEVWLHGSFNLGGTVSGRLSSSDPNLQNIPAGSIYGKLIKEFFGWLEGYIFAGADFNSLEDYISALTTKDPNKLDVYIKGFDGHCLRAAYYFRDQLLHIDLADPNSVNTIKKQYPELRQESKAPTFALTYQGTWRTLVANLGWSEKKSKDIETNYHILYTVSDQYIHDRLKQASKDGYVEVAFGLRVRTPLLGQVVYGAARMPSAAAAEGRTAGNAMGQSYGLLNNRAAVEFWQKVWASPYRYDILPCALIHDAIYMVIKENPAAVEWANRELIKSMRWQELPEIQHPVVKLGAALDLFWPHWANPITLNNDADQADIIKMCRQAKHDYYNPKPEKETM